MENNDNITKESIWFYLHLVPPTTTCQAKKINRRTGKVFDSPSLKAAKKVYRDTINDMIEFGLIHKPERPREDITCMHLEFFYPYEGKQRLKKLYKPYTEKPDADNAAKLLIDSLVGAGLIKDDKMIATLIVRQRWTVGPDAAGVLVHMSNNEKEFWRKIAWDIDELECPRS